MKRYHGGPLDGQPVTGPARSLYRDHTGRPKPASWGDRRLTWQSWQRGESGLYVRRGWGYTWRDRSEDELEIG
jgi:hypothetical protein